MGFRVQGLGFWIWDSRIKVLIWRLEIWAGSGMCDAWTHVWTVTD